MLLIKSLNKYYTRPNFKEKIEIFNNLDLELAPAQTLSVIGRSGSGKSTLLAMIAGLDRQYEGQIKFNDIDLKSADEATMAQIRANHIGIVFQQYHLMEHLTALENIMLPLEILAIDKPQAKAMALLDKVGLAERSGHFPHQLSGGEKQRVAIARAIVSKRSLILADEPTGNLDEKNGLLISQLFFDLVEVYKTALIMVTHSMEMAARASKIMIINNKQLLDYKKSA